MARTPMSRAESALLVAAPVLAMAAILIGTILDLDLGVMLIAVVAIIALGAAGWGFLTRSHGPRR